MKKISRKELAKTQKVFNAIKYELGLGGFSSDITGAVSFRSRQCWKTLVSLGLLMTNEPDNKPGVTYEYHHVLSRLGKEVSNIFSFYDKLVKEKYAN